MRKLNKNRKPKLNYMHDFLKENDIEEKKEVVYDKSIDNEENQNQNEQKEAYDDQKYYEFQKLFIPKNMYDEKEELKDNIEQEYQMLFRSVDNEIEIQKNFFPQKKQQANFDGGVTPNYMEDNYDINKKISYPNYFRENEVRRDINNGYYSIFEEIEKVGDYIKNYKIEINPKLFFKEKENILRKERIIFNPIIEAFRTEDDIFKNKPIDNKMIKVNNDFDAEGMYKIMNEIDKKNIGPVIDDKKINKEMKEDKKDDIVKDEIKIDENDSNNDMEENNINMEEEENEEEPKDSNL